MKNFLSGQKGFAPIIIILALALVGAGSVGTVTAANNSKPGDPLFGLDTALEQIQVNLAGNDEAKAKVHIEIAKERLGELQELENENKDVDEAVNQTQLAVDNATNELNSVETKVREHKITLTSTDLQALLTELQNVLASHQGLVRRVEIKIKDGQVRAKVKLFEQEASGSAKKIEDDLNDLEDDGELNDSHQDENENEQENENEDDRHENEATRGGEQRSTRIQNSNRGSSSIRTPRPSSKGDDREDDDKKSGDSSKSSNSGSGNSGSGSGGSGSGSSGSGSSGESGGRHGGDD